MALYNIRICLRENKIFSSVIHFFSFLTKTILVVRTNTKLTWRGLCVASVMCQEIHSKVLAFGTSVNRHVRFYLSLFLSHYLQTQTHTFVCVCMCAHAKGTSHVSVFLVRLLHGLYSSNQSICPVT